MLADMKLLFERGGAKGIDLKTRVAAAEALGVSGHPYLRLPKDDDYWCKIPGHGKIKPFLLGRFPVTVWEYGKFVDAGGAKPGEWEDQLLHPSRPVVSVSWHDATAYCGWASCRLPSADERQFAVQGTDSREFPWGNALPDDTRANVDRWVGAPSPVGMFPNGRSPYGCDDMSGNVWEWTSTKSWLGFEVRGGPWNYDRDISRYSARSGNYADARDSVFGFRCARDIATPPC